MSPPDAGIRQIDLALGEPKRPVPSIVTGLMPDLSSEWNRYARADGERAIRAAIAGWLSRRYLLPPAFLDPDVHVLPCAGTREALAMCLQILDDPGSGKSLVLLPQLSYPPYEAAAVLVGSVPVFMPDSPRPGEILDLEALEQAERRSQLLSRSAALFVCSPSAPQGIVASRQHLSALMRLCRRYGVLLVVDECYSEIYRQRPPAGILEVLAVQDGGGLDGVLVFNSLSKRSSVAGLRSGLICGDPVLIAALRKLRNYTCVAMALPIQKISAALWADEEHVISSRLAYRANWAAAAHALGELYPFSPPEAGFFAWLDISPFKTSSEGAARELWSDEGVRVMPGAFLTREGQHGAHDDYVRLALVHDLGTTVDALTRVVTCLRRSSNKSSAKPNSRRTKWTSM